MLLLSGFPCYTGGGTSAGRGAVTTLCGGGVERLRCGRSVPSRCWFLLGLLGGDGGAGAGVGRGRRYREVSDGRPKVAARPGFGGARHCSFAYQIN